MGDTFASFDWAGDERWIQYLRNVELMDDSPAAMERLKQRFYKKKIDPLWEPASAAPKASSASADSSGLRQRPAAASAASAGASAAAAPPQGSAPGRSWGAWARSWMNSGGSGTNNGPPLRSQQHEKTLFLLHCLLLTLLFFHLVPVLPIAACSLRCYWMFMQLAALTQGYKVYLRFGKPPGLWPFNWQQLSMWLSQAMACSAFFHAMTAFAFMSTRSSITPAMGPVALLAARSALAYADGRFRGNVLWQRSGAQAAAWAASNAAKLDATACWSEIVIGFVLVLLLLTPNRNFILIFFYWQMLKVRYVTPESAARHREAWAWLDSKTYAHRAKVPIVERGIQLFKSWFLNMGGMRQ